MKGPRYSVKEVVVGVLALIFALSISAAVIGGFIGLVITIAKKITVFLT